MNLKLTSLTALAALALAPAHALAAPAAGSFAAFQTICADTHVDFAAISAAASAGGWEPAEVTGDSSLPGATVTDKVALVKRGGAELTLFAWRGTTKNGVHVSGCTVRVSRGELADLQSAAAAWTGFPAQDSTPKKATFRLSDAADGRHALAGSADYEAAAAGPGMELLTITGDSHGAVIDLLKIKK